LNSNVGALVVAWLTIAEAIAINASHATSSLKPLWLALMGLWDGRRDVILQHPGQTWAVLLPQSATRIRLI